MKLELSLATGLPHELLYNQGNWENIQPYGMTNKFRFMKAVSNV